MDFCSCCFIWIFFSEEVTGSLDSIRRKRCLPVLSFAALTIQWGFQNNEYEVGFDSVTKYDDVIDSNSSWPTGWLSLAFNPSRLSVSVNKLIIYMMTLLKPFNKMQTT